LKAELPDAELVFTHGWIHELLSIHSAEELDCIRRAGKLCEDAMNALVARARPGVTDIQLRAAAGAAILEGGGDIDFLILASTPMASPSVVFGSPRPSGRVLAKDDIINMELAAGYRGYTAQIGSPICVGPPTDMVKRFWDEIALTGFELMAKEIKPGNPVEAIRTAGRFFRDKGVQSRPIHAHGIDLITDGPHVFTHATEAEEFERVFRPGMVFMAEPNQISADGMFGIFLGHTFIVTESGNECVDKFPWELVVAGD
jgi:Xaa-Pro dipeptidase